MDVITDEDFDRLWDEAVAEAAVKKIKQQLKNQSRKVDQLPERGKGLRYAPSTKQQRPTYKRHNSLQLGRKSKTGNELPRNRSSESIRNDLANRRRSDYSSHRSDYSDQSRRRSSESNSHDLNRRRTSASRIGHDLLRRTSSSTEAKNSQTRRRSSSESKGQKSSESSDHEIDRRRSTMSRVPSLPSLKEFSKDTVRGREGLSKDKLQRRDGLSAVEPAGNTMSPVDDQSSSVVSGFSGYESVSENRRKQRGQLRPNGRSPTRDAKEQIHIEGGQQEVVNYVMEVEQQRLLFDIPKTFEVKGHKENRDQSTGLVLSFGLENDAGTVMVKEISPTSLFANTRLKAGDEMLMINSHRVKSPQQAAKIMKSLGGDVTIYVSEGTRAPGMKYVRVKAGMKKIVNGHVKDSAIEDVTFVTQTNGLVRVAQVDPGGVFSKNLGAGDAVITVNGTLVQNEEEAKKRLLDTMNHGVICMLVYSMANLCQGLIDQLFPSWKRSWVSELEVTLSRDNVSFSVVWRDDWVCECNHSEDEDVYNSDILPAIGKMNLATSFVIKSIIEASEAQRKQISLLADCKTGTATTDPTTEETTENESDEAGSELEETHEVTDPPTEKGSDICDVNGESGPAPTETLEESSKSKRLPVQEGNSLSLELDDGDESSVEEC
mmetsp:Transcript_11837/g.18180  ORF Transcript_11837/g.18180 Transcript_11837/m.18180 type:complete len:660 (-) Transcript_11837:66-2045(-)